MMTKYTDLLIFDLDGTLIDSRADLVLAVNLTLTELGFAPIPAESVVSFVGEGARLLVDRALRRSAPETAYGEAEIDATLQVFRRHYAAHLTDSTVLYPHVREVLGALRNKQKAVISNKPAEFSNHILDRLGIRPHFAAVLGGDSLPTRKPDPGPVWHVLELCRVPREHSLIIGDSRIDIDCGRAAGIYTCGVTYGFRPRAELERAEPDLIIDSLHELPAHFA